MKQQNILIGVAVIAALWYIMKDDDKEEIDPKTGKAVKKKKSSGFS